MLLFCRFTAASARRKVGAIAYFAFGIFMGAIAITILNPLDPMSWCSHENGCAFYPDNRISVLLGLLCYTTSASLLWAAGASLDGKRGPLLALPVSILALAFVGYIVERLAHAWP